jgi:hypothetical protein
MKFLTLASSTFTVVATYVFTPTLASSFTPDSTHTLASRQQLSPSACLRTKCYNQAAAITGSPCGPGSDMNNHDLCSTYQCSWYVFYLECSVFLLSAHTECITVGFHIILMVTYSIRFIASTNGGMHLLNATVVRNVVLMTGLSKEDRTSASTIKSM